MIDQPSRFYDDTEFINVFVTGLQAMKYTVQVKQFYNSIDYLDYSKNKLEPIKESLDTAYSQHDLLNNKFNEIIDRIKTLCRDEKNITNATGRTS